MGKGGEKNHLHESWTPVTMPIWPIKVRWKKWSKWPTSRTIFQPHQPPGALLVFCVPKISMENPTKLAPRNKEVLHPQLIHNNDPYQPDVYILVIAGWYVYDLYQQNMNNIYIYIYQFWFSSYNWLIYSRYDLYLHKKKNHINQLKKQFFFASGDIAYDVYIYIYIYIWFIPINQL